MHDGGVMVGSKMLKAASCGALTLLCMFVARPATADDARPCAAEAAAAAASGDDPALAYPTEPAAVERLEAGNRAFRVQQYDRAIEEYTAAGLATSAPLVLYNLGQGLRSAKQYDKAIRQYELFLSRGNPGPTWRALVECHIATMKAELDSAASTAPPSGPAPDHSEQLLHSPPAETPSRWTTRRKIALGVAAGGVLAAGAGMVFGLRASGFEDDAAEICPTASCERADEANDLVDKAESNALYANIAFGVGAAAVVTATVLWFTGAPETEAQPVARIVPRVTSDSAGFIVRLSF